MYTTQTRDTWREITIETKPQIFHSLNLFPHDFTHDSKIVVLQTDHVFLNT